jgi:hypothetical protein
MAEEIKEMASSQQSMGISGMGSIENTIENKVIKLDKKDLEKLHKLRLDELQSIKEAEEAVKRRDKFCLQLENRYLIKGQKWDVDFSKGTIHIIAPKETDGKTGE